MLAFFSSSSSSSSSVWVFEFNIHHDLYRTFDYIRIYSPALDVKVLVGFFFT